MTSLVPARLGPLDAVAPGAAAGIESPEGPLFGAELFGAELFGAELFAAELFAAELFGPETSADGEPAVSVTVPPAPPEEIVPLLD
jgi:hypothetical protein